jgi:hypothetical protein
MDYLNNIADPAGDSTAADKLAADLQAGIAALVKNKLDFSNNVFFKILTSKQRHPALVCEMRLKQVMMEKQLKKICAGAGSGAVRAPQR